MSGYYLCVECGYYFTNQMTLWRHIDAQHHFCLECRRFFESANNLQQHLNSKLHKIPTVLCFGYPHCERKFIAFSDALLHIEGGKCQSGLTGSMIRNWVIRNDRTNIITNPDRLIRQTSSQRDGPVPKMYATERARNRWGYYECVICHKEFDQLQDLNRHYGSSVHDVKVFRCPKWSEGCRNPEFVDLSSLVRHVENGRCGAMDVIRDLCEEVMINITKLRLT